MINNLTHYSRGFTLVETLVAVLLLTVAIAGPLTVASRAFSSALVARDQVIAYYLAQDAMEYVRYRRDSTCLAAPADAPCPVGTGSGQWLSGFGSCTGTGICSVDSVSSSVATCNPLLVIGTNCALNYDKSLNRYTHSAVSLPTIEATKFKRYFTIANTLTSGNEALVTVTVQWASPGTSAGMTGCPANTRCVILKETMFNWQ